MCEAFAYYNWNSKNSSYGTYNQTTNVHRVFKIIAKIFQQFYKWKFTTILLEKSVSVVVCKGLYHVLLVEFLASCCKNVDSGSSISAGLHICNWEAKFHFQLHVELFHPTPPLPLPPYGKKRWLVLFSVYTSVIYRIGIYPEFNLITWLR